MSKNLKKSIYYDKIHRFWTGLSVICMVITVVASFLAGARVFIIIFRALMVLLVLYVIGRIIIKSWVSWEELSRGQGEGADS